MLSRQSLVARSSMEEMLDSLRLRDELEKPKDMPPALPARPASRARRRSSRYTLPRSFAVGEHENLPMSTPKQGAKSKELGYKVNSFGSKKKREQSLDSPYDAAEIEKKNEPKTQYANEGVAHAKPSKTVLPSIPEDFEDEISYFTKTKLRVWCRIKGGYWESGTIQSNTGEKVSVTLSNGTVTKVSQGDLFPANPVILDGVEDLIQLSYLNEPSVLYNLEYRYSHDMIYSKAGPVLIAINPLKKVNIYENDVLMAYRQNLEDKPHVYALTDAAYNEMMRDEVNQSIIISGESGAGKTETAKRAMQYLAALGGGSSGIEDEILQSSCILEAFGNAKTSRNDNSSRFGKLVDIHFSRAGKICGANIQTFLLEKSRVVQLAYGERSYHIFYQLCAGAPTILKESLNLKMPNEFKYLNQSNCLTIDGVDDARDFHKLMEALNTVQICKEDQEQVLAMLAAVLWMGNISFQVIDNENHVEVVDDEAVSNASRLMGCSTQDLMSALSTHKIRAGKDTIAKKLTQQQAFDTRDALAKFIYASLFDWLVEQINKSLEVGKERTGRSISILDIYGFESFPKNSFEQFCINYANERLQQHFNRHLFKLEQEEYELEGIDWTKVEFEDNQECLDLIEKKPIGVLSLLDEESNFPRGSDLTLANKLKQHLNSSRCFKGERDGAFTIRHYAANVIYDTSGFLEKNRDPVQCDSINLLSSCSCQLPQLFASRISNKLQKPSHSGGLDSQKQSVVTKFKNQLFKLMHQLESTTPHFIRCIKPNDKQLPGLYQEDLVLHQLRCCGVLEVVRIARSGYPTRMSHQEFAGRYGVLLSDINVSQDPLSLSVAILQQFNVLPEMYQIGYTKLYLRTGQLAELEDRRRQLLYCVVWLQRCFRRYRTRCDFNELKEGVTALQSFVRGEKARKEYDALLQSCSASSPYLDEHRRAAIYLQSAVRGWLVRKHISFVRSVKKSSTESAKSTQKLELGSSELKDIPPNHVYVEELHMRVAKAETALVKKEEENAVLQEKVNMYEKRWSEYEVKMKLMEEMWQKQMNSLQTSLAAARSSLAADNTVPPGKDDGPRSKYSEVNPSRRSRAQTSLAAARSSLAANNTAPPGKGDGRRSNYSEVYSEVNPSMGSRAQTSLAAASSHAAGNKVPPGKVDGPRSHYSEVNMSTGSRPPDGNFQKRSNDGSAAGNSNGGSDTGVGSLVKEFERQKQSFDNEATSINISSTSSTATHPLEELKRLKTKFQSWKREFKGRLEEEKLKLIKQGGSDVERRRKWWGKVRAST